MQIRLGIAAAWLGLTLKSKKLHETKQQVGPQQKDELTKYSESFKEKGDSFKKVEIIIINL